MSQQTSIYHSFASMLLEQGQDTSPAELQGLMFGRCCAGASLSADSCIEDLQALFDEQVPASLHQALTGLQEMLKTELATSESMALTLLLPDDESPMQERIQAMAQWCQGFLAGFGSHIGQASLSADAKEVLEDYVAISQLDGEQELDDDEASYMQLSEYLRVTPLLLFSEYGKPPFTEPAEQPPAVH